MKTSKQVSNYLTSIMLGWFTLLVVFCSIYLPSISTQTKQSKTRIPEVELQLLKGKALISQSPILHKETQTVSGKILDLCKTHLPPHTGRYGWALEALSEWAYEENIEVDIQEHPHQRFIPISNVEKVNPNSIPMWVTYPVDVKMRVGFDELIGYLNQIHDHLPFCSLAALEITALPTTPEIHRVEMTLEWPVLRFMQDADHLDHAMNFTIDNF